MRVWHECCMCKDVLGGGVSDNDDSDDDSNDNDSNDESGRDLSLEIDDLVKGMIPGKRWVRVGRKRVGRAICQYPDTVYRFGVGLLVCACLPCRAACWA